MGQHVLKTPVRRPQANAFWERLIGTMRRECLDWLIPIHEGHLRWILREWVTHDNRGRPHSSLGAGIPDPLSERQQLVPTGHRLPEPSRRSRRRFSAGCTMNTTWRRRRRDRPHVVVQEYCGRQPVCRS